MKEANDQETQAALAQATALIAEKRLDEAAAVVEALLGGEPGLAGALALKGQIAALRGDARAAAAAFEAALAARPGLPLWKPLGRIRMALGDPSGAAVALGQAVKADPADADGWSSFGLVLHALKRPRDAEAAWRRAIELAPQALANHLNLAVLLSETGRAEEAEASCRRALELQPQLAPAHATLGDILRTLGRTEDAEAAYRQALELEPGAAMALRGLANLLAAKGETEAARSILQDLVARAPSLDDQLRAAMLQPVIPGSLAEIEESRARCANGIAEAAQADGRLAEGGEATLTFHLAYQGLCNRPIMTALDALLTDKAAELTYVAPALAAERAAQVAGAPIKVGFVSEHLYNHTVGRVFQGLIERLDRARFEVVVMHLGATPRDRVRRAIDASALVLQAPPSDLRVQRMGLEAAGLDILVFPDIGMTAGSYRLARSRLAPVQAVGWGHPDTTGLSTVDYFVSWDRAEPPGGEAHYAERLIRLPRLGAWLEAREPGPQRDREALGLPAQGALYGCLQSLFKLHPDFDAVLGEIAWRDPDGWLVFAQGVEPHWETLLRRRWAAVPGLNDRAIFLPRRPSDEYMALLAEMDVVLDPPHFGSGNTFFDAMALGVPVVTWPGEFARGRIVSAAYAQMGAGEGYVAESLARYANLAVTAAHEARAARGDLRAAAEAGLFRDQAAVRGFETFLEAAVAASAKGELLPSGWGPTD